MKPALADVKTHLRVDSANEDALISSMIDTAYLAAGNWLRRDLDVDYPAALPAPISAAIMMHVGSLFENREATAEVDLSAVPMGYKMLLESYRLFPV